MTSTAQQAIAEEVQLRMARCDGILAMAGHQIEDPQIRALLARVAAEELTAEEAIAEGRRLIESR